MIYAGISRWLLNAEFPSNHTILSGLPVSYSAQFNVFLYLSEFQNLCSNTQKWNTVNPKLVLIFGFANQTPEKISAEALVLKMKTVRQLNSVRKMERAIAAFFNSTLKIWVDNGCAVCNSAAPGHEQL